MVYYKELHFKYLLKDLVGLINSLPAFSRWIKKNLVSSEHHPVVKFQTSTRNVNQGVKIILNVNIDEIYICEL